MAYDEDLANRVRELLAGEVGVIEQPMFGGLSFLIGGHMSVSVSGRGGLLLHCEAQETEVLLGKPHASPMLRRGKPLNGWVFVAAEGLTTKRTLKPWVERGVRVARSLPPKGRR
jgi:TfoX N-terminal domain